MCEGSRPLFEFAFCDTFRTLRLRRASPDVNCALKTQDSNQHGGKETRHSSFIH
jgi:hypothetical protein